MQITSRNGNLDLITLSEIADISASEKYNILAGYAGFCHLLTGNRFHFLALIIERQLKVNSPPGCKKRGND
jgi:hypothetical protein